ncbi:MFS transporter [Shewanella schlegeliana]|uniref:MFS transporter n=2 Tax=Shewanella schlegeliana TaxID=190308 RepID=A0ABS1SUT7_9GAMM|nr:MFS transporter [Shewanella schlegeliana]MBL4912293.1 MFS transporter [Shewanella schlegeliana]MCL1108238.1 MFS transporter [Shewanella schlegeliana]
MLTKNYQQEHRFIPFNVWLLTLAQAFAMSATPMMMLLGGLIGADIAPSPQMATLPIASMVIGLALSVLPVSRLMQRFGRKPVFIGGALLGACSGLVAAFATSQQNFVLFCLSAAMLGAAGAVVQQYRFAAMESVAEPMIAKAASRVLLGGLVAAVIGPELAILGAKLWPQAYVGAFFFLTLVSLIAAVILGFYRENELEREWSTPLVQDKARPLTEILAQSQLWVAVAGATLGYAMMSFVMTATPLHMHHVEHHSLEDTKWVIQSHIIAMYLPSLFSGILVARLGVSKMMLLGLLAYLVTIISALIGRELLNYWAALVLLGIGWNFLFVAGTSLLPRCYDKSERYKVQSFNDSFVFGAQAMASLCAGWVIHLLGWNMLLISCLPLIAVQLLLVLWWKWSRSQQASRL